MVFSSLLFIYIFLPVNLLCYALISDIKKKNICVLIFSLIFYAWSSPKFLLVLMVVALINYFGAIYIDKYRDTRKSAWVLAADIGLSLGFLCYFKYLGFISEISRFITGIPKIIPEVVLPVGISFYTFQLISYVVDVYRKEIEADHNYGRVLLYTSLFHQCIAGPIVRYKDIASDLKERKTDINSMNDGISRFCVGLAKKTLLANSCASILDSILPENVIQISNVSVLGAWIGGLLYFLEIYLDFSAYSDMAIGLGKMTGFHYKENFNYPYTANSVTDFWRRWHISLSAFFRDYLYIPLGGNRKGIKRQLLNMLIVWGLTGLWHGASMNFVLWGLYFFAFLSFEKLFLLRLFDKLYGVAGTLIRHIYTILVVFFGWILFRFSDFNMISAMLKSMFGMNGNTFTNFETNTLIVNNLAFILIAVIASTPLCKIVAGIFKKRSRQGVVGYTYAYNILNVVIPVVLLFLSTIALIGNSYNPFIYFRF
ncbi:MAG: MBOAT family O-acyltransferase [Eubacteriales bacterium]|nr:MBOAT family O-acyltransferase [Eubacteriales bacterium]